MTRTKIETLISAAAERNETLSALLRSDGVTGDLLSAQAALLRKNRAVSPMQSPADFTEACHSYLAERMGKDAELALPALRLGAIHTADHHGGIYSPQSFQGDLLFGKFLQRVGDTSGVIPILSFSQVPLGNATHARGILCFPDAREPCSVPFFGRLQDNQMVFATPGYDNARLRQASIRAGNRLPEGNIRKTVLWLLDEIYGNPAIKNQKRYADQVFSLGVELSHRLFPGRGPLLYIEAEEILRKLIPLDLANPDSLLYRVLTETALRRPMNETLLENGLSVSASLFYGVDRKGRRVRLNLCPDGVLRGQGLGGVEVEYSADPECLSNAIARRELLPAVPAAVLVLAWARGLTWFGGVFQSLYLPAWQQTFVNLLEGAGFPTLADAVRPWDCSGYLSGPIFVLSPVEGGAVHAGPVEFLARPTALSRLADWTDIPLKDCHVMGMFEFYHDLIPMKERLEGWYGELASYMGTRFPERIL